MKGTFTLDEVGPGLESLRKAIDALTVGESFVVAGLTGNRATKPRGEGKPSSVDLALIHEFGAPAANIPARPFIFPAFQKHKAEYQALLAAAVKRAIVVGAVEGFRGAGEYLRLLGAIGAKMAADMKAFVTQGPQVPPPNAPATLARKWRKGAWKKKGAPALDEFGRLEDPNAEGAPRTLVNSGRMVGAITWAVRRGSEK